MRNMISYVLVIAFSILSFLICFDYVVDMYNLKNNQIGSSNELTRDEVVDTVEGYYTITYDLNGGILVNSNPDRYNLFTETFVLNNPTKQGFEFTGWTGTNLDNPTKNVSVKKGSSGNLSYVAHYSVVLASPRLVYDAPIISWQAVSNADCYFVKLGENGPETDVAGCSFDLSSYCDDISSDNITVSVRAYNEEFSAYSESVSILIDCSNLLSTPLLALNGSILSWEPVEHASYYVVSSGGLGGDLVTLEGCSVDLTLYQDMIHVPGDWIYVQAFANDNVTSDSAMLVLNSSEIFGNKMTYELPVLLHVNYHNYYKPGTTLVGDECYSVTGYFELQKTKYSFSYQGYCTGSSTGYKEIADKSYENAFCEALSTQTLKFMPSVYRDDYPNQPVEPSVYISIMRALCHFLLCSFDETFDCTTAPDFSLDIADEYPRTFDSDGKRVLFDSLSINCVFDSFVVEYENVNY